jgi:hypothetical protein
MRTARDVILVICAVISTACLLYIALHLDTTTEMDPDEPTPRANLYSQPH